MKLVSRKQMRHLMRKRDASVKAPSLRVWPLSSISQNKLLAIGLRPHDDRSLNARTFPAFWRDIDKARPNNAHGRVDLVGVT